MMTDYDRYQLEWMIAHGHSLRELVDELTLWQDEVEVAPGANLSVRDVFDAWADGRGFGGEIFACEAEWAECEAPATEDFPSYNAQNRWLIRVTPPRNGFDALITVYDKSKTALNTAFPTPYKCAEVDIHAFARFMEPATFWKDHGHTLGLHELNPDLPDDLHDFVEREDLASIRDWVAETYGRYLSRYVPDPAVTIGEMRDYGYLWDVSDNPDWQGELPVSRETARSFLNEGVEVHLLYPDGSESIVESAEQLDCFDGMFGVDRSDWLSWQDRRSAACNMQEQGVSLAGEAKAQREAATALSGDASLPPLAKDVSR